MTTTGPNSKSDSAIDTIPAPRRSQRVRQRPSPIHKERQNDQSPSPSSPASSASFSSDDNDVQEEDEYLPPQDDDETHPRKRLRSKSFQPSTLARTGSGAGTGTDPSARTTRARPARPQLYPADDPEMTPIAPVARRGVVRDSALTRPLDQKEEERFAALRHRSSIPHLAGGHATISTTGLISADGSGEQQGTQSLEGNLDSHETQSHSVDELSKSRPEADGNTGDSVPRSSPRTRLRQTQLAREAGIQEQLTWATGAEEEQKEPPDAQSTMFEEAATPWEGSPRPISLGAAAPRPLHSGKRKLDQLRQRTAAASSRKRMDPLAHSAAVQPQRAIGKASESHDLREAKRGADQAWAAFWSRQNAGNADAVPSTSLGSHPAPTSVSYEERTPAQHVPPLHPPEPREHDSRTDMAPKPESPQPQGREQGQSKAVTTDPHSLASWLGLAPKESDLPEPVTREAATIVDRDSLFIGYVYPLESSRPAEISTILNHLTHKMHPQVPVHLLPPNLRSAPPSKRGASHDMYALRVLQLRPGRTGEKGAADYSVFEVNEDDGETWGSQKILNAMRELGMVDVLCVVSRWYGGVMLGPVRFNHIHQVAAHALEAFRTQEQVVPLLEQVSDLDNQLDSLKREMALIMRKPSQGGMGGPGCASPATAVSVRDSGRYAHVQSLDQAQKLLSARQAAVRAQRQALVRAQTKVQSPAQSHSQTEPPRPQREGENQTLAQEQPHTQAQPPNESQAKTQAHPREPQGPGQATSQGAHHCKEAAENPADGE